MSEICVILIRSGSKGIKNKNIKKIKSYPLIYYTLSSALKSKIFEKIIISSDSKKYFSIIKKLFPNEKKIDYFFRSKKNAKDNTSSEVSILEIFKKKDLIENFKTCYFIQATSPLLKKEDLIISRKIYFKMKFDSLFSGFKEKIFYWKKNNNSKYVSLNYNFKKRPRRQKFEFTFFENGAFYIFNIKLFMKYKNRLFKNIGFYEMPKYRSFEIDEKEDIKFIKKII